MMTEKLGLTQEQQDKIKAIIVKNADAFKALMAKGRENLTEEDKTKLRELMKTQSEETAAVLTDEQKAKINAIIHMSRMGSADEIAAAAVYLASNEAAYTTGATIHVNGGMSMV